MKLDLLTPERRLANQVDVQWVTLPTSEGQVQILPGHAAMIGTLETGPMSYQFTIDQQPQTGVISSGFFEVLGDVITVMAETAELKQEIDLARAKKAQQKSEEALKSSQYDEHNFKKYQLKLQRALIRQQIAGHDH